MNRQAATRHRVNRVINFVHANLDRPLGLDGLAAVACLSKFHFTRVFQAHCRETPFRYLWRVRLERAARRLVYDAEASVTESPWTAASPPRRPFPRPSRRASPHFPRRSGPARFGSRRTGRSRPCPGRRRGARFGSYAGPRAVLPISATSAPTDARPGGSPPPLPGLTPGRKRAVSPLATCRASVSARTIGGSRRRPTAPMTPACRSHPRSARTRSSAFRSSRPAATRSSRWPVRAHSCCPIGNGWSPAGAMGPELGVDLCVRLTA